MKTVKFSRNSNMMVSDRRKKTPAHKQPNGKSMKSSQQHYEYSNIKRKSRTTFTVSSTRED